MIDIEKLVSEARADLEKRESHRESWCETREIKALLKAGAIPIDINKGQIMGTYLHVVFYKGLTFANATKAPVRKLKKYLKNK